MSAAGIVHTFPDASALCHAAALQFVEAAARASQSHGRFTVALAGGSTPNDVYALLATEAFKSRVPWSDVHVFWGDERCVSPDDSRSNYRGAYERLLSHVPIPPVNVHRMRGELQPEDAAAEYESLLRHHFATPAGAPGFADDSRFDLIMLGVGTDGHTASLFPDGAAVNDAAHWVLADNPASAATWRMTLTLPVINAAAAVQFLVAGDAKRAIVDRILHRCDDGALLPAQRVRPQAGTLVWLLDQAATPA